MKKLLIAVVLVLVALASAVGYVYLRIIEYPRTPGPGTGVPVTLEIARGVNPTALCAQLAAAGVVTDAGYFCWYMRYVDGFAVVQAGTHVIPDNASPQDLLFVHLATKPMAREVTVTLPEGLTLHEMAPLIESAGLATSADFLALVLDPARAAAAGVAFQNLEGFLFPDTYRFTPAAGAEAVVVRMRTRMREVLDELRAAHPAGVATLASLGWHDPEWIILASMVEKETGPKDDSRDIASVFLNRMLDPKFVPKLLGSDPTIIYGLGPEFTGNLLRSHLEDRTNRYNTYVHAGLPPGPIAAPGRESLVSVVSPHETDYLFFVARGDGSSHFTATYAAHERAVDCYQRRGRCAPGLPPRP